ncbi:hypothetical protein [Roseomonas elaeocarpi]
MRQPRTPRRDGEGVPGRVPFHPRLLWGLALCLLVLPALPAGAQGRRGAAPPPPRPAARELAVTNHTDTPLRELYLRAAGSGAATPPAPGRGEDLLGEDLLAPDATRRLRLPGRGCSFDVAAVFADDREEARQNLDLCRDGRLALGDPAVPRRIVTVENHAGRPLAELYAQPSGRVPREPSRPAARGAAPGGASPGTGATPGTDEGDEAAVAPDPWGIDRLDDTSVADGGTRRLTLRVPDCRVDLRAVYEDDAAEEKRDVDVCHEARIRFDGSGIPRPPDVPFVLVNRHAAPIAEFYVSAASDSDWGSDRLAGPLDRGGQQRLTAAVDCVADLRAVFPNGAAEERREVDLCATGVVVVRPGWTVAARLDEGAPDLPPPPPRPGSLRLRNRGGVPVVQLYLGAAGAAPDAPAGPDRLGRNVLGAGETLDLQPPEPGACAASLRAVFRDGTELRRDPIDLCSGTEVPLP